MVTLPQSSEDPADWVMLTFEGGVWDMIKFTNELNTAFGSELTAEEVRVGVNAVNVRKDLYEKYKEALPGSTFGYTTRYL